MVYIMQPKGERMDKVKNTVRVVARGLASEVWWWSETTGIGLGRFAPTVMRAMLGWPEMKKLGKW